MSDTDAMVRQQAVKSFALIKKDKAVNDILNYTLSFTSLPDIETAQQALLQTVGEDVQLLVDKLSTAPDGAKIALIHVIAAKGNSTNFNALFDQIEQQGEVRSSALENLFRVASYEHLNTLMILFDQLENKEESLHIERAIVASVNSSPDRSGAIQMVLSYASEKSSIRKFIGVLGSLGGKEALSSVYKAYITGDARTKKEDFNALLKSK